MQTILDLIVDVLSQPAILVALIAFIGLVVQKKPVSVVTSGTIKTILGFLVLSAGAGVVVQSLEPFGKIFQHAFGVQGVVPNNEAIISIALEKYGTTAALIMVFGMLVNILIARVSNLKFIFLTGHHTFYMAAFLAIILTVGHIKGVLTVILGALILGLIMAVFPALAQPTMRKITGNDQVALGHFGTVSYWAAGEVGKLFKGHSKSTEEINFPKGLSFLRESTISISLTMILLYLIASLFAGVGYVHDEISKDQNFIVFSLIQGVTFAAGVFIILTGVRLILAEIVPAFKGISEKLVPHSKPALDCPIVFPYAQNAVLIGFFVSFLTGVLGMFVMFLIGGVVILPGVVPHFFLGATSGVFGNARGGIKGAVAGSALNGLLITFLPLLFLPFLGDLGLASTTFSDTDFLVVGIVFGNIVKYLGIVGLVIGIIIVAAVAIVLQKRGRTVSEATKS
ncbi:PTS ascorbate transporter subunit IIC [Staphylococcus pseudintermedius]|uniref:Ascorbate-specific PTS system EIIC component n=4 Tax=Staphylococcus pseudintermedius TaxID=283734 RepID=A0A8H9EQZ6_STAPS|nr:PTS ascorbate transporter subunit IIC [Staphylococcus pseudintermedius]ADX75543.1 ascorbate-specific PTS system enzyme IIC [Staphylococcus pseudintermedius ED99]EGQ0287631.1 PTS ascorbate transporter subunit IIC [Staphylococcus pseudintermedius]EGQ0292469.1 PTS ascorbate transporter subunit IIC [Staphylococcus pseudintermedius]EGQ0294856.1 PTS ascorbate transporter subunit IIC [Staphylococcus pseudintermedius]EGQ0297529.1 PTS ascorbate transporter subunit IIC [Staphylococcus pseudintermediu